MVYHCYFACLYQDTRDASPPSRQLFLARISNKDPACVHITNYQRTMASTQQHSGLIFGVNVDASCYSKRNDIKSTADWTNLVSGIMSAFADGDKRYASDIILADCFDGDVDPTGYAAVISGGTPMNPDIIDTTRLPGCVAGMIVDLSTSSLFMSGDKAAIHDAVTWACTSGTGPSVDALQPDAHVHVDKEPWLRGIHGKGFVGIYTLVGDASAKTKGLIVVCSRGLNGVDTLRHQLNDADKKTRLTYSQFAVNTCTHLREGCRRNVLRMLQETVFKLGFRRASPGVSDIHASQKKMHMNDNPTDAVLNEYRDAPRIASDVAFLNEFDIIVPHLNNTVVFANDMTVVKDAQHMIVSFDRDGPRYGLFLIPTTAFDTNVGCGVSSAVFDAGWCGRSDKWLPKKEATTGVKMFSCVFFHQSGGGGGGGHNGV